MSTSYKLLLSLGLALGTLLSISSSSWFSIWLGMEINTMMFLPMIAYSHKLASEVALKYFIIQTVSSIVLIIACVSVMKETPMMIHLSSPMLPPTDLLLIQLALLMKLGAAPLHFWFPQLVEGMNWMNNLLLLTWQKIAPAMILLITGPNIIILGCGILSVLIGTLGGLNQMSLRKLMAFSSISHLGWTIISMGSSDFMFIFYLFTYCILSSSIIIILHSMSAASVIQIFMNKNNSLLFMLPLFSLGGLPPFLGFLPKWMVLNSLISSGSLITSLVLILCAIATLTYYIRISLALMLLMNASHSWINHQFQPAGWTVLLAPSSLLALPMMALLQ